MKPTSDSTSASLLYLWPKRTLFIGQLAEQVALKQGAATLTVSLDHEIQLYLPDSNKHLRCQSVVMPAGYQVVVQTKDAIVANCNLDVFGRDYAHLLSRSGAQIDTLGYTIENEKELQKMFSELLKQQTAPEKACQLLEQRLACTGEAMPAHYVDPRVEKVVAMIQSTATENTSLEALAGAVNISSQRLIQLFKQQTGIPIRRYRLWHRMFRTASYIAQGSSMTDAAINAGFSDSAHFAHTFRSMFGTTPSNIFFNRKDLRIYIGQ